MVQAGLRRKNTYFLRTCCSFVSRAVRQKGFRTRCHTLRTSSCAVRACLTARRAAGLRRSNKVWIGDRPVEACIFPPRECGDMFWVKSLIGVRACDVARFRSNDGQMSANSATLGTHSANLARPTRDARRTDFRPLSSSVSPNLGTMWSHPRRLWSKPTWWKPAQVWPSPDLVDTTPGLVVEPAKIASNMCRLCRNARNVRLGGRATEPHERAGTSQSGTSATAKR